MPEILKSPETEKRSFQEHQTLQARFLYGKDFLNPALVISEEYFKKELLEGTPEKEAYQLVNVASNVDRRQFWQREGRDTLTFDQKVEQWEQGLQRAFENKVQKGLFAEDTEQGQRLTTVFQSLGIRDVKSFEKEDAQVLYRDFFSGTDKTTDSEKFVTRIVENYADHDQFAADRQHIQWLANIFGHDYGAEIITNIADALAKQKFNKVNELVEATKKDEGGQLRVNVIGGATPERQREKELLEFIWSNTKEDEPPLESQFKEAFTAEQSDHEPNREEEKVEDQTLLAEELREMLKDNPLADQIDYIEDKLKDEYLNTSEKVALRRNLVSHLGKILENLREKGAEDKYIQYVDNLIRRDLITAADMEEKARREAADAIYEHITHREPEEVAQNKGDVILEETKLEPTIVAPVVETQPEIKNTGNTPIQTKPNLELVKKLPEKTISLSGKGDLLSEVKNIIGTSSEGILHIEAIPQNLAEYAKTLKLPKRAKIKDISTIIQDEKLKANGKIDVPFGSVKFSVEFKNSDKSGMQIVGTPDIAYSGSANLAKEEVEESVNNLNTLITKKLTEQMDGKAQIFNFSIKGDKLVFDVRKTPTSS